MGRVVGIDLGTSNSVVATIENGRPIVIPNREGNSLTPSMVTFTQGGRQLVGQTAKSQAVANPTRTITSIKRRMGTYNSVEIDGQRHTPQEVSSYILHKVKSDAECYLGERIEKVVVTVPAYFDDNQRKATKEACLLAGLDVIRIINEPTAAALAYGLYRQDIHTVLVWDLGGGTFDVSILELGGGIFEVKAVNGNTQLGGDDWNQRIVDYLISALQEEQAVVLRQDEVAMQILNEAAEKAKIELSTSMATVVKLPFSIKGEKSTLLETPLTRSEFEKLTLDLRQKLIAPTQQALQDARLKPDDIDRVLLVGGSTRMPAIKQLAKELLGKEPYAHINPDEVVAIGATIQAGILAGKIKDVVLVDITPLSLGVETQGGLFTKIIARNTTIPCSRSQIFTTATDYQTSMDIHVLQGERAMAKDNVSLGKFQLDGISPAMPGEPRVEVTFSIDTNGIVQISAQDLYTDNERKLKISSPIRISESEIERAIAEAQEHVIQDRKQKEMVELRIRANNLLAAVNQLIQASGKDFEESLLTEIKKATSKVESALAGSAFKVLWSATEELEKLARGSSNRAESGDTVERSVIGGIDGLGITGEEESL